MRNVTITVYKYLDLCGYERNKAKHILNRDWDSNIKNMSDDEISTFCDNHEIEFTEEGDVW